VSQATPVFDRGAWFQTLQDQLKSTPYPDRLVEGVIKMNLPVLGSPSILTSSRFVRPFADGTESASITGPRLGWPAISTSYSPPTGVSTRVRSACYHTLKPCRPRPNGWRRMWKPPAREPAAWKAAWPITSRPCARDWSITYKRKGCSPSRLLHRCRITRQVAGRQPPHSTANSE
jgi:hypothetical protein